MVSINNKAMLLKQVKKDMPCVTDNEDAKAWVEFIEFIENMFHNEVKIDLINLCCNFAFYESKEAGLNDGFLDHELRFVASNGYAFFNA